MSDGKFLKFEILNKHSLHKGFFQLNKYQMKNELFGGGWSETYDREIFERGHAAAVLLLDPAREILILIEQFRPGAVETASTPWLLEIVAGMIEKGEPPQEVVKRESVEEAGCKISRLSKICEYLVSPGGTTEKIWLYLGETDASYIDEYGGLSEEHEDIKIHPIKVEDAFAMLENGQFNNSMTIIAMQWLKLNWDKREEFWR